MENRIWRNKSVSLLQEEYPDKDVIEIIKIKSRNLILMAMEKGWNGPPYDPMELASIMGIEISPNEEIPDALVKPIRGNKYLIQYNPYQNINRINFSIAHELGHTLFSDCSETIRNRVQGKESGDSWELEFLANVAAAEILIPYSEFAHEVNSLELKLESLLNLSAKYKASLESIFLRFCDTINKPCTIAIASFDENDNLEIDYSKSSLSSPLSLPPGFCIPKESKIHDIIRSGWTTHTLEQWSIFSNSRYRIYAIGLTSLKGMFKPRVGMFFVPEFYDSEPMHGIYTVYGDATNPRGKGKKVITQVVNTGGGMGFGFGRQMVKKYPKIQKAVKSWKENKESFYLGSTNIVNIDEQLYIFQILAQKGLYPVKNEIPLKYSKLNEGLQKLKVFAQSIEASVHMPMIGAGQAKGDWKVIEGMIYEELVAKGVSVTVYMLPGKIKPIKSGSNLTLFE